MENVLPQAPDVEKALLASIPLYPESHPEVFALDRSAFYSTLNATYYGILQQMFRDGLQIDVITISQRISGESNASELDNLRCDLIDKVAGTSDLSGCVRILREKAALRKMIAACHKAISIAWDCDQPNRAIGDLQMELAELQGSMTTLKAERVSKLIPGVRASIKAMSDGATIGIPTCFGRLDERTGGLQRGDLVILAARPSMGKTSLAMQIAINASKSGYVAVVFSLETKKDTLLIRSLCTQEKVDFHALRSGSLSVIDVPTLESGIDRIEKSPLYILDSARVTEADVVAVLNQVKRDAGRVDLCIIDYMQRMSASAACENKRLEVAHISNSLKAAAMGFDIPVVALAQLSRSVEARPNKRPIMSDLKESGDIEQDADVVLMIYRDEYYNHKTEKAGIAELIIGKQRNGPVGYLEMTFQSKFARFDDMSERSAPNGDWRD